MKPSLIAHAGCPKSGCVIVAKLTLEEARKQGRCRICTQSVRPVPLLDAQSGRFLGMALPDVLVLNYGKEFAHQKCLKAK